MRRHTYLGPARFRVWWSKLLGIAVASASTLLAAFFLWGAWQGKPPDTMLCVAAWCLAFGWGLGLYFYHAYPSVTVSKDGLEIAFLWHTIPVAWSDVVEM